MIVLRFAILMEIPLAISIGWQGNNKLTPTYSVHIPNQEHAGYLNLGITCTVEVHEGILQVFVPGWHVHAVQIQFLVSQLVYLPPKPQKTIVLSSFLWVWVWVYFSGWVWVKLGIKLFQPVIFFPGYFGQIRGSTRWFRNDVDVSRQVKSSGTDAEEVCGWSSEQQLRRGCPISMGSHLAIGGYGMGMGQNWYFW
jgi:hypothetical protein